MADRGPIAVALCTPCCILIPTVAVDVTDRASSVMLQDLRASIVAYTSAYHAEDGDMVMTIL